MQSFQWVDATSVEEAARLLGATNGSTTVVAKAGGMDLVDLMKEGIVAPTRIVNLKSIESLGGLQFDERAGLRLGALVTLADIAGDARVRKRYGALASAAEHAATPQVRNAATIGGNVLQRPRSWYLSNAHFYTNGSEPTADAQHRYGAIFDNSKTAMVRASTPVTALVAYGASVHLTDAQGKSRSVTQCRARSC